MKQQIFDSSSLWNFNISGELPPWRKFNQTKKNQSLIFMANPSKLSYSMQSQKDKKDEEIKSDEPTTEKDEVKKAEQKTMELQKIADSKKKENKPKK